MKYGNGHEGRNHCPEVKIVSNRDTLASIINDSGLDTCNENLVSYTNSSNIWVNTYVNAVILNNESLTVRELV